MSNFRAVDEQAYLVILHLEPIGMPVVAGFIVDGQAAAPGHITIGVGGGLRLRMAAEGAWLLQVKHAGLVAIFPLLLCRREYEIPTMILQQAHHLQAYFDGIIAYHRLIRDSKCGRAGGINLYLFLPLHHRPALRAAPAGETVR